MFNQFYKQQFAQPEPNVFITLYNAITPITIQGIQSDLNQNAQGIRKVLNLKQDSKHISFYLGPNTILTENFQRRGLVGSKIDNNIKIFFDMGAFKSLSNNKFTANQQLNLLYLPAITGMGSNFNIVRAFTNNSIGLIYLGNPNIDVNTLDNSNADYFRKDNSKSSELFLDDSVQTAINGAEPNRVQVHNNTAGSFTTYIPNRTKPPKTTDLSTINISGTYIELGFTQPSHDNALKYVLVFVNGFFQDIYDVNNVYVTNLSQQTEYEIKIILADKYFNLSGYSNTIKATTTQVTPAFTDIPATIDWQREQGHTGDVFNETNATNIYDQNNTTFEFKNVIIPQNPIGVLLESGAKGDGMAISFDNTNLVAAAGNGATLSTDTETVFVNIAHSSFQNMLVDIYVSIKPTATGKIKVWVFEADTNNLIISGQDIISDASQMGTQDVNGDWTGGDAIGVGVENSIRDGVNAQQFNGTMIQGARGYNNYLPSVF